MITVDDVLDKNKKNAQLAGEQNEELLKTGVVKAKKRSYLPMIVLAAGAVAIGIWLWVQGKKDNGGISG